MLIRASRRAVSLGLLSLLAACAAPMGTAPVSTADGPSVAAAVSAYRVSRGLPPVVLDPALARAAAMQSGAMASQGQLSHGAGGALRTRLSAAGVRDVPAVENIGRGHASADRALASWKTSAAHDANLRHPDMTRIGFARADGPGGPWWTMVMAGEPRADRRWAFGSRP